MSDFGIIYRLSRFLVFVFCKVYFRITFTYDPSIDWNGHYLVVSNHASFLDPPLLGVGMKKGTHFLAKRELRKMPLVGKMIFSTYGGVPVKRGTGDIQALKSVISLLKNKKNVVIFPEGTRTLDGNFRKPRAGIGMVAYHARPAILPVYIHNSFEAMPKGASFPKPVKISMHFGKPYKSDYYDGEKSKEVYQKISDEMMSRIKALQPQSRK